MAVATESRSWMLLWNEEQHGRVHFGFQLLCEVRAKNNRCRSQKSTSPQLLKKSACEWRCTFHVAPRPPQAKASHEPGTKRFIMLDQLCILGLGRPGTSLRTRCCLNSSSISLLSNLKRHGGFQKEGAQQRPMGTPKNGGPKILQKPLPLGPSPPNMEPLLFANVS